MSESGPPKSKITATEKLAREKALKYKERLQRIHYDDNLTKQENHTLKSELKYLQGERMREQLMQRLSKSKSHSNAAMVHSLSSKSMHQYDQEKVHSNSSLPKHNHPQNSWMESSIHDSLPIIKRKGTGYHRRFVNEVRPRDYGLYLNSLNTLKDYRAAETENKQIKKHLFREKYRQQMGEYKMFSQAAWQKMDELSKRKMTEAKQVEKKPVDQKSGEVKKEEKKPVDQKPVEVKKEEKKPVDLKPVENKDKPKEQLKAANDNEDF